MRKLNIIKKIICIIILFLSLIMLVAKTDAVDYYEDIGQYEISRFDLRNDPYIYCMERSTIIGIDYNYKHPYVEYMTVKISGKKAIITLNGRKYEITASQNAVLAYLFCAEKGKDANGTYVSYKYGHVDTAGEEGKTYIDNINYYPGNTLDEKKVVAADVKAGVRQVAIWYYIRSWWNNVIIPNNITTYTPKFDNDEQMTNIDWAFKRFEQDAYAYDRGEIDNDKIYEVEITFLRNLKSEKNTEDRYHVKVTEDIEENSRQKLLVVKPNINIKGKGELTVEKKDKTMNTPLHVGFKVKVKNSGWLAVNDNGSYNYNATFNNATQFYTGRPNTDGEEHGEKILSNLSIYHEYQIWENKVNSDDYYDLSKQGSEYDGNIKAANLTGKNVWIDLSKEPNYKKTVTYENVVKKGIINVEKVDKETGEKLNVTFKVQTKNGENTWLIKNSDGSYNYQGAFQNATEFTTPSGKRSITDLSVRTEYKIWETKPASQYYSLEEQTGYDSTKKAVNLTGGTWIDILNATNNTKNVSYTNQKQKGNLTVKKYDPITGRYLSGMEFAVQTGNRTYLSGSEGSWNYNSSWENARKFTITDANRGYTINGLQVGRTYNIWETKTPNSYYDLTKQSNYSSGAAKLNDRNGNSNISITANRTIIREYPNFPKIGNLLVNKIDEDDPSVKLRIGFKVQTDVGNNTWLQQNSDGTYKYNATYQNATQYYTDSGTKTITNLPIYYKYKVWENIAPSALYPLESQKNYDSSMKAVKLSEFVTLPANSTYTVNGTNKKVISISGYVWVDKETKEFVYNSLYKQNTLEADTLLSGVTVNLKKKRDNSTVASATTNTNGEYKFSNIIYYSDLKDYYVEFDYSKLTIDGRSGKEYIPVAYNSKDLRSIVKKGSRAMMENVATKDRELTGIATTYKGINATYSATYGLEALAGTSLYNSSNNTLENINLGIKPIYKPEYELAEDIAYVRIVLNNHEYIYKYGEKGLSNMVAAPQVSFQNPTVGAYERAVYPSAIYDLKEKEKNGNTNGAIKLYVVYEMLIYNKDHQEAELYKEKELHITSLTNTFDTNRYEFDYSTSSISGTDNEFITLQNNIKNDFSNWNVSGNTAKYKNEIVVGPGKATTKYIQFRVKDDEIKRILINQTEMRENRPTVVDSNGYHIYNRNDYSWNNLPNLPKEQRHETIKQDDNDSAPYLKFKLGEERKITGTVFEDKVVTNNGEILGNGRYDNGENKVAGAVVELVSGSGNFETASVTKKYVASRDKKTYTVQEAKYTTGSDGTFSIEGVMPGEYYLRITYANGEQCLIVPGNKKVDIDEYKSTIVTNNVAKAALGNGINNYGNQWYKYLGGNNNYSVAVDSLTTRAEHNSGNKKDSMIAGTAKLDITIENTTSNYSKVDKNFKQKETFGGFNFGIIVQPEQKLSISKKITNVKLTNVPNVLFNGNPETSNADEMPGVTDLDGIKNQGSTFTRMELEKESIYGSELELTYDIEVENVSDINYYETKETNKGWYYKFGEHGTYSKPIQVNLEEVIDCYDPVLTYKAQEGSGIKVIKVDNKDEAQQKCVEAQQTLANNREPDKYKYSEVLLINKQQNIARGSKATIANLQFNKILSSSDKDLDFINVAGISKAKITPESSHTENPTARETLKYSKPVVLPEPALAEATVMAPTGSNSYVMLVTYVVSGIIVLSLIAIAILVIIKRKK